MWFALRDLAFGETGYPEPEIPEVARPEAEATPFPQVARRIVRTVHFLANLLMIELRAEIGFAFTETLLRDPELFPDRRPEAERAADIVQRIRTDERIHVESLRLVLGELRSLQLKTRDGGLLEGHHLVDDLWGGVVRWATDEQPRRLADLQRRIFTDRILAHPDGDRILDRFLAEEADS